MNVGNGGKWLTGIEPNDPVSCAARSAAETRLQFLWDALKTAGQAKNPTPEEVHQARVAARRAMAALETFETLLPRRRGKWMKKQVKRIRRAAGAARDDDVLLMRWQQSSTQSVTSDESAEQPLWQAQLQAERSLHQAPIRRIYRQLKRKQFRQRAKQLVKRIHWRGEEPEPTYRAAALEGVSTLLASLESSLTGPLPTEEAMHPLRIAGKGLRYSLELFAGAFANSLMHEEIYPQVESMQDVLGEVNDHVSAIERIEAWLHQSPDEATRESLQQLFDQECESLQIAQAKVEHWWQAGESSVLYARLRQLVADDER